jgi:hypothetical protein
MTEYERLLAAVEKRAGESFRSAFSYTASDWTALHVRSDLATGDLKDAVPELAERARAAEPVVEPEIYDRLGSATTSVELYADAVLLHFRTGEQSGVVLTLDEDVAQSLSEFTERLAETIDA